MLYTYFAVFTEVAVSGSNTPHRRTFIPSSVSLRNDLSDPVFDGVGLAGSSVNGDGVGLAGFIGLAASSLFVSWCFTFLFFHGLVLWGWDLRTDRVLIALSQPCIAILFRSDATYDMESISIDYPLNVRTVWKSFQLNNSY